MVAAGVVGGATSLVGLRAAPIGIGAMADTYRLELDWAGPGSAPRSAVVKLPSADPAAADTAASLGAYEREVRFYEQFAHEVDVDVPALLGVVEVDGRRSGLILEDLTDVAHPLDQMSAAPLALVRRARDYLAGLQAPYWNDEAVGSQEWLHRRLGVPIPHIADRMARSWAVARERLAADFPSAEREVIDRFVPRAAAWAESLSGPFSLTHHDYRFDNMLQGEQRLLVLDWQTVGWGVPMFDVAYLLGTSLEPEVRAKVERDEIARHVAELARRGVDWDLDEAWHAYRKASFAILLMLVPPTGSVKQSERSDRMFRRLLSFGARMAIDLDALEFLDDVRPQAVGTTDATAAAPQPQEMEES